MIPFLASSIGLPLLVLLLRIFDTRGPVQDWYRACCVAGGSVLSGLVFLLQDPACYVLIGKTSMTFPMSPLVAAVCLLTGAIQVRSLLARQCRAAEGETSFPSRGRPGSVPGDLSTREITAGARIAGRLMRENVRKRGLQLHQSRIAFARPMARLEEIMRDRGIEPRSPGWKPGVVPLDQSRGVIEIKAEGERVEPSRLVARPISNQVPSPFGLPFPISRRLDRRGVEPRFPGCKPGVVPLDQQPNSSSTGGSRTHRHQSLDLIAMPIRVPCRRSLNRQPVTQHFRCGPGSRTAASEHMKLGRAPARPHVPGPGIDPGEPAL